MSKIKIFCKISRVMHTKCRNSVYPRSSVHRLQVPDDKIVWGEEWSSYQPPMYTDPRCIGQAWADPEISDDFQPKWNVLDGNVNRKSHNGEYCVKNNRPLNPQGRTGLSGRGCLGRWGPNHAADPIVTRWKMSADQVFCHEASQRPMLQFVAIKRHDCGEWAIPGGMVDPGEEVTATLKREFMEEALNSLELLPGEQAESLVSKIFSAGKEVYRGYVDDPRNTDNAWMETVAVNFHDEGGTSVARLSLHAGDDATGVTWMDVDGSLLLYASHRTFIQQVASAHNAHW